MAEVVGVRLHGQAIYAYHATVLLLGVILTVVVVVVVARFRQYAVGDKVLTRAVALHDGLNEVLGYILVVREQLLRIFGQTVAAIAKRWVVVVRANAWVKTYAIDDGLRIQSFHLGVGVQLVEVTHAQCQIGVGEEFHRLCLGEAHEQGVHFGLQCTLLQQRSKLLSCLH